jgi:hypothetical protein
MSGMDIMWNTTAITDIFVRRADAISEVITECTGAGRRMGKPADMMEIPIVATIKVMIVDIEDIATEEINVRKIFNHQIILIEMKKYFYLRHSHLFQ